MGSVTGRDRHARQKLYNAWLPACLCHAGLGPGKPCLGCDLTECAAPAPCSLQARRLGIRLRGQQGPDGESKKEFVHMLNGTLTGQYDAACSALGMCGHVPGACAWRWCCLPGVQGRIKEAGCRCVLPWVQGLQW
jgi:hypothetical protein